MLTDGEINTLVARIASHLRPERIIVFGSYAKGSATPHSDLDMLIVLDTPMAEEYRPQLVAPLIADHSVPIDAHVITPAELAALSAVRYSFMDAAVRTGRVIYERRDCRS
ncbi:nucleotidyltransferase domain-containing protein [Micromonospora sp. NPDC023814]|uniref:nucleotidyltransferase domain-containing protein n=1 Tax=Micromonospora sp. NPDC023814 TaxID=3154596 RepID=UPI0033F86CB5